MNEKEMRKELAKAMGITVEELEKIAQNPREYLKNKAAKKRLVSFYSVFKRLFNRLVCIVSSSQT